MLYILALWSLYTNRHYSSTEDIQN